MMKVGDGTLAGVNTIRGTNRLAFGAMLSGFLSVLGAAHGWPACTCSNMSLCQPLGTSPPRPDVHVYADGGGVPHSPAQYNWSAISTLVIMSGHPLQVTSNGSVFVREESGWPDSQLICTAHAHNVRVVVTALRAESMSFAKLLGNASAIDRMASELAAAAAAAGADGVEFDFEGIVKATSNATFDVGDAHVHMVASTQRAVSAAIHAGTTTLTMGAVNLSSPVYQPYYHDYPIDRLGAVSDGIFIMAYDMWHAHARCAGPNSPLSILESNVRSFLTRGVHPQKLLLGIPWYGYEYPCNGTSAFPESACARSTCIDGNASHPGGPIGAFSYWAVAEKVSNASLRCTLGYDTTWQSPFYDCGAGAARTQGWYDDPRSTRAKVAMARKLGLGGWGVFTTGDAGVGDAAAQMWTALA
jgi:di-N-acetylchitobiase